LTGCCGDAHDGVVERVTAMFVSTARRFLPGGRDAGKKTVPDRHQHRMTPHEALSPYRGCSHGPPLDVRAWRRCRLLEAGFAAELAEAVAADPRFDLHVLLGLVDRGCPPHLAVRIAAPLPTGVG
jgi:hypothetical protein